MLEELAAKVSPTLLHESGKVFYSSRDAFQLGRPLYILGLNPGGPPDQGVSETVAANLDHVLRPENHAWSSYCDESWGGKPPGIATFQPVLCELLVQLGLHPRTTPASNLIFVRSARAAGLSKPKLLEHSCWPLHQAVIEKIKPKAILALGRDAGRALARRLGAEGVIERWSETNERRWTSTLSQTKAGPLLLTLAHPGVAKWTTPAVDPRPFAVRVLRDYGVIEATASTLRQ
jgi:Uracil DNA glycosylase superfamily